MTMQLPEHLVVDEGAVRLPTMQLFGVLVGNIDNPKSWSGYKFSATGNPEKITMCTALWRGYVSTYRLRADGSLTLELLEYPYSDNATPDEVNESLKGNFWLDLRAGFLGDGVRVPFIDGLIQADSSFWRHGQGLAPRRQAHQ